MKRLWQQKNKIAEKPNPSYPRGCGGLGFFFCLENDWFGEILCKHIGDMEKFSIPSRRGKPSPLFHSRKPEKESFPQSYTHYPQKDGGDFVEKKKIFRFFGRRGKALNFPVFAKKGKIGGAINQILSTKAEKNAQKSLRKKIYAFPHFFSKEKKEFCKFWRIT